MRTKLCKLQHYSVTKAMKIVKNSQKFAKFATKETNICIRFIG